MNIGTKGQPDSFDTYPDLTRVEVIDHRKGRQVVRAFSADQRDQGPFLVSVSPQDQGRTLKIFLEDA
jgi:hypothetical protein